jgi:hypothetical protein
MPMYALSVFPTLFPAQKNTVEGPNKATKEGEWEPIKILDKNLTYVPNRSHRASLLARSRPHSYQKTIDHQKTQQKHESVQTKLQANLMQQKQIP